MADNQQIFVMKNIGDLILFAFFFVPACLLLLIFTEELGFWLIFVAYLIYGSVMSFWKYNFGLRIDRTNGLLTIPKLNFLILTKKFISVPIASVRSVKVTVNKSTHYVKPSSNSSGDYVPGHYVEKKFIFVKILVDSKWIDVQFLFINQAENFAQYLLDSR